MIEQQQLRRRKAEDDLIRVIHSISPTNMEHILGVFDCVEGTHETLDQFKRELYSLEGTEKPRVGQQIFVFVILLILLTILLALAALAYSV